MTGKINSRSDPKACGGMLAAVYFKYYLQFESSKIVKAVPMSKIGARQLYSAHRRAFDSVFNLFSSADMEQSLEPYIKFFVLDLHKKIRSINGELASKDSLNKYLLHVLHLRKLRAAFDSFFKTVDYAVSECLSRNLPSVKDLLRELIRENKVGVMYICGNLSRSFLAAIPGFDKVVGKLDYFSKLDLNDLAEKYEIYNSEINEAFMRFKHAKANPIAIVDSRIADERPAYVRKMAEKIFSTGPYDSLARYSK